jgi:hypothetical protein
MYPRRFVAENKPPPLSNTCYGWVRAERLAEAPASKWPANSSPLVRGHWPVRRVGGQGAVVVPRGTGGRLYGLAKPIRVRPLRAHRHVREGGWSISWTVL